MTVQKTQRNVSLDLLRILSMLLIIFLHSIDHSGVLEQAENCGTGMYLYVRYMYALCQVCVNLYIMLSGYFMISSKFRLQKLISLWMEAAFYSFIFKLLFMLTGAESFSITSLASCFFPILTGRYWFLTIYVGMYALSPFMNMLVRALDKKQHLLLNLTLFALMSLWSSIHPAIAGMNSGGGWGLAWFVVLYLAAAWLRLYYPPRRKHAMSCFAAFLLIPLLMAVAYCLIPVGMVHSVANNWFSYDAAPVYIMTLCLFIGFLNIDIRSARLSKMILRIAPLTLGVYLIHAHANVSPWLWNMLNLPARMEYATFSIEQTIYVLLIFSVCIFIDSIRKAISIKLSRFVRMDLFCEKIESKIRTNFYLF